MADYHEYSKGRIASSSSTIRRIVPDTLARAGSTSPRTKGGVLVRGVLPVPRRGRRDRESAGGRHQGLSTCVLSPAVRRASAIVEEAARLGAKALWQHEGFTPEERQEAEAMVTSAGLRYIDTPYILMRGRGAS